MFDAPFKSCFTYPEILNAYLDCRRRKRSKLVCTKYEINFERNLEHLLEELNSGTYEIGPTRAFVVTNPKPREVWAAQFRDRIVHHLLYNTIGEHYEKQFIVDTFSCIKGRGTYHASERLHQLCRRITNNWDKPAWYLQFDIANFFVSINRNVLWDIMKRDLGTVSIVAKLMKQIIFNDPTKNAILKNNTDFSIIPPHKSLWHCPKHNGLPIGNLTSQFMSNVYLDGLDQYIKHILRAKYYVRYVDDAVILHTNRELLQDCVEKINFWLENNRLLHLHPNKIIIAPITQGIDFVGRIIKPFRVYARHRVVSATKETVKQLKKDWRNEYLGRSFQSYLGMLSCSDTFSLRKELCEQLYIPFFFEHNSEYSKIRQYLF